MLLCPLNVSHGRRDGVLDRIAAAAGSQLLDLHADEHHHRSVLWLAGEEAPRAVAAEAVRRLDLRRHRGVHPRLGVVDVVPFVPHGPATMPEAQAARARYARWSEDELGVPAVPYGEGERSLPEVRRAAAAERQAHPSAGITAVGARGPLVAFNVWLAADDPALARRVAAAVRRPGIRALGFRVGERCQVSMNLVAPLAVGPAAAYDAVAALAPVDGAELVGLVPAAVLDRVPRTRWAELDLAADRTVEARLARAGFDPAGRPGR